jgi:hypothetical protein
VSATRIDDLDGRLLELLRGPAVDLEIRPEHLAHYRGDVLSNVSAERRPQVERELRDMPLPEGFPAFDRLERDAAGHLWARRFLRPGDERRFWAVFSLEGVLLGEVEVPRELQVTEIGADYVLGIARDELGVERVRLHGLEKGAAG